MPTLEYQPQQTQPWYAQVTRYQWLVLIIASAGWVFDVFEGQLFNITRGDMLRQLLAGADDKTQKWWGDLVLAGFLLGGTVGGILFGNLADRFGRKPAMIASIIFYSVFSALTYFATNIWHVAILRFLVGLGVGGEWAVAAALVAEVFPAQARARAGGIFHATSVLGTWLAALAALLVGTNWRYAYLLGLAPALLVLWVRSSIKEPQRWQEAGAHQQKKLGSFRDLGYSYEWLPDGSLRATTPVLPAVRKLPNGRTSFFNQLIAAAMGWKDARNDPSKSITFGDGTPLDRDAVILATQLGEELSFDILWQSGDVALVDNYVAMHGRRTFSGTRKVLASLVASA